MRLHRELVARAALIGTAVGCALEPGDNTPPPSTNPAGDGRLQLGAGGSGQYFAHGAEATLIAGPGGPEDLLYRGSRQANGTRAGGDQQALIDQLVASGGNALYVHAVKSHGGDGIFANGSYPACPRQSSCYKYSNPFRAGDPKNAADPRILDQWFAWLSRADSAGIVTHLFLYDDASCPWLSLATGGRIANRAQCRAQPGMIPEEDAHLVTPLVNRFKSLSNIVWVIAEEYSEALTAGRTSAIAARIRALDPIHPIAVHQLSGTSFDFPADSNIRVFQMQLGPEVNTPELVYASVTQAVAANSYAVELAESAWQQSLVAAGDRTTLRLSNWAAVMAGAAGVLVYGMWEPAAPDPGMLGDLRRLETFFEASTWIGMRSAAASVAGGTKYALADDAGGLILYSDVCAPAALLGYSGVAQERDYMLSWFDPVDGSTSEEMLRLYPGAVELAAPHHVNGECAVWAR